MMEKLLQKLLQTFRRKNVQVLHVHFKGHKGEGCATGGASVSQMSR